MPNTMVPILILLTLGYIQITRGGLLHTWTYSIISAESYTSNAILLNPKVYTERLKRSMALSGQIDWQYDPNDTCFELRLSRSATGNSDYGISPFGLRKTDFVTYLNDFYKNILYPSVADCSNIPKVDKDFRLPYPHTLLKLDKCLPKIDDLPTHMLPGFYKIELIFTGEVDWNVTIIINVQPK